MCCNILSSLLLILTEATDEMVRVCHFEAMLLFCPLSPSLPSITETKKNASVTEEAFCFSDGGEGGRERAESNRASLHVVCCMYGTACC